MRTAILLRDKYLIMNASLRSVIHILKSHFLKRCVLHSKMVRFTMQNGAFYNAKWCVLQNDMQEGCKNHMQERDQSKPFA